MSPEEVCRHEAERIAQYWFPRSRVNREALTHDVYLALARAVEVAFVAGLQRAPEQNAAIRLTPTLHGESIARDAL